MLREIKADVPEKYSWFKHILFRHSVHRKGLVGGVLNCDNTRPQFKPLTFMLIIQMYIEQRRKTVITYDDNRADE